MAVSMLSHTHRRLPSVVVEVGRWALLLLAVLGLVLLSGPFMIG